MERALTNLERDFLEAEGMNFAMVARVTGGLTAELCRRAMALVQKRHPLLSVRIDQAGGPRFKPSRGEPIPLREVRRTSDTQWEAELEEELNTALPWAKGPLVRGVLLHAPAVSEIIITFHHAIGDGYSGIYFLRDLLRSATALNEGTEPRLEPLRVRPPLSALLPASARGPRALAKVLSLLRSVVGDMWPRPSKLPVETHARMEDRRSRVMHHSLSPAITQALVERCRAEGTTVQGALMAAMLRSIARVLARSGAAAPRLGCFCAIDLRKQLVPPIGDDFGLFTSGALTFHEVSGSERFWACARDARKKLLAAAEHALALSVLQHYVPPPPSRGQGGSAKLESALMGAALITNMKEAPLETRYGSFEVEQLFLTVANKSFGSSITLVVVTFRGQMEFEFAYTEPIISRARAEEVFRSMQEELQAALRHP